MWGEAALTERSDELEALDSACRGALSGRGEVVLIEGPAGIGKSRLLSVVLEEPAAGEVLCAQGGVLERDIPFGVARQLLERRLLRAPSSERRALLAGPAARAEQVLGIITDAVPENAPQPSRDVGASLHCLYWLLLNLAERAPLVLTVDDAHWADLASLHFLVYLARRIEDLPVLLVAAIRDGERGPQESLLGELAASATIIRPAPLRVAGVKELVERILGASAAPELAEACRAATGGNPFLLLELLRAIDSMDKDAASMTLDDIRAAAPSSVARSVLLRIGRLSGSAPRLAVAAALLGDRAALRHAAALARLSASEAEEAADTLVRNSLLAGVHPLRFEHPLVRESIVTDLPPAERAAAHGRAARLLRDDGEADERIIPHLLRAAPTGDEWVVATLRRAARAAMDRGTPEVAIRLLRRGLEEPPVCDRATLLGDLAAAELASGNYQQSALTARQAIEAASDGASRAKIRLGQTAALLAVEGAEAALQNLEKGIAEASDADPQLALLMEGQLVLNAWFSDIAHPVLDRIAVYRELPGATHSERFMLAVLAFDAIRRDERAAVVRKLALRALNDGRLVTESSAQDLAYHAATAALIEAEAYNDAGQAIDAGARDAMTRGCRVSFAGVCWQRAMLSLREGNLPAAEADARANIDNTVPTMVGVGASTLALVLLEQGDVAGAHRELEQHGLLGSQRPVYLWGPYVRGLVLLAEGCPQDALVDFEEVGRHATEVGGIAAGLPWHAHAALALHALGREAEARQAARVELERARRRETPRILGIALRVCGLVASGEEERVTRLAEAVAVLETSGAKLELARARFDLGVAQLRAGKRSSGRELLEKSLEGARLCGALGLQQAAHEELKIAGARPRRLMFSGVESLTASERRVAQMAAGGLTNRAIAQALFVAPKTVENHLSRAYAKLGVSSRRALARALDLRQEAPTAKR